MKVMRTSTIEHPVDVHVNTVDTTDVIRRLVGRPGELRHRRTPRWRPRLLRPACFFSGSTRLFSGFFFVISSNVLTLIERRAGEVGLYLRIGMSKRSLLPA